MKPTVAQKRQAAIPKKVGLAKVAAARVSRKKSASRAARHTAARRSSGGY